MDTTRAIPGPGWRHACGEVFTRPDCTWNYCPHPERCQERCAYPLEMHINSEGELSEDDQRQLADLMRRAFASVDPRPQGGK